jgi:hypothetical protein
MRKLNFYSLISFSVILMTFFNAPLFDYCPIRFSDIGLLLLLSYAVIRGKKLMISRRSKWAVFLYYG